MRNFSYYLNTRLDILVDHDVTTISATPPMMRLVRNDNRGVLLMMESYIAGLMPRFLWRCSRHVLAGHLTPSLQP